MTRSVSLAALAMAAAALSACSTASKVGDALWPFNGEGPPPQTAPQEGRISILTFEQQLTANPELAGRAISAPAPIDLPNWNQPGGVPDNAPVHINGGTGLEIAGRTSIGAGSSDNRRISASPVTDGGKLFFFDADQTINAIDLSTGRRLWSQRLRPEDGRDKNAMGGGVAASDGRVYVTSGFGFVTAFDAATGSQVWSTRADAPFNGAPTVSGGRIYAVTNDSELLALDAATGAVQWNYQAIAEPARILAASSPAVDGDTIVAPFASGEVVALLAANGRRLWVDSLSRSGRLTSLSAINDIAGRPAVDNGVAYAASHSGVLAAIDLRSGQRVWARAFASTQTPWIAGDVLYAVNVDGELAAFDRTNGEVYWVKQLQRFVDERKREDRIAWAGPIMVGGQLILANSAGQVVAVSPANGEVAVTRDVGDPVFIPPIAAGGSVYVVTDKARLITLR